MAAPQSQYVASDQLRDHPDVVDSITFYTQLGEPARRVVAVVLGPLASVVESIAAEARANGDLPAGLAMT